MALDDKTVARMDASVRAYWGTDALAAGGRRKELAGALFMQTAIPHCLFNSVILSGQDPATIEAALELSTACLKAFGVPVLWRLSASADSKELRARLTQAGLQAGGTQPAMQADLSRMPALQTVDWLVIETANGAAARRDWGRLAIQAFEMEDALGQAMGNCEATIPAELFDEQPRFTGYLDGEPVAVSSLVMTDGVAGIYAVATLPRARKRGIGAAMTLYAMAEGRRRGASIAMLQASDMGRPVYEKIGFETVFHYQNYLQSA